nr:hypothetical protein [Citrobacter phage vB_Cfr_Xman]
MGCSFVCFVSMCVMYHNQDLMQLLFAPEGAIFNAFSF